MTGSEQQTLAALYKRYNVVIKPLIAEIEARSEKMPLPLFNEIRAFNDHVAHCYVKIDEMVDCRSEDVRWAKVRFRVKRIVTIALWVLSVLLSALVSIWLSCDMLPSLF